MKVLLDEVTPVALRQALAPHNVEHVFDLGWQGIQNGELLTLAEAAGFEALVTLDSNMPYQQTMVGRCIALVVLRLGTQGRAAVLAVAPEIIAKFESIVPGSVVVIDRRPGAV